jgi:glycosyltransferase involved in cell wall biosynthesis
MDISIIVPLYYGRKYVSSIISQVTCCYNKLKNASIELILYNDSPDEEVNLSEIKTDYQLKLIQPKYNRGIHAARVEGLKNANGTYVLFLDQDDIIHEDYLYSQLNGIGDNDAIVCRLKNNNKQHYNDSFVFEKVVSKEFMINKWCSIVSPGQVLIRRQSIPQIWEDNLLSNNGADDYFLWILMFMQGNKFALNQNILFKHVLNGSNTSSDTNKMMDSELEMLGILHDNHILDDEQIKNLVNSLRRIHISELEKSKRLCDFLIKWNYEVVNERVPYRKLLENNVKSVAIYGAADLGQNIAMLLNKSPVKVEYYIDQNARYISLSKSIYKLDDELKRVDAIILTINDKKLRKNISDKMNCKVYCVEEIIG